MLRKSQERNKSGDPQSQQLSRHPQDLQRKCACSALEDEPHKGHSSKVAKRLVRSASSRDLSPFVEGLGVVHRAIMDAQPLRVADGRGGLIICHESGLKDPLGNVLVQGRL